MTSANPLTATPYTIEQITDSSQVGPALRRELIQCWVDVTNSGGAVGFLPPVTPHDIAPVATAMIDGLHPLWSRLLVARDRDGLAGWLALARENHPLVSHWATVKRLQTHPRCRARGIASTLMTRARDVARDELGLEQLHLTARSALGLERFYERLGWRIIGRHPSALRVAPGDDRDEIHMLLAPL
jgi:GNAT superfamily N-acetyltransferase